MKDRKNQLLYIVLAFFIMGMINMTFSILGIFCMVFPFVLYAKYKERIWCKYICPRAGFFQKVIGKISLNIKPPKFFTGETMKQITINYFIVNILFIIFSTVMVYLGKLAPMIYLRFFIAFKIPITIPQLLVLDLPVFLYHLGFRVYSVMFTSIVIGSILGIIFKPRLWCGFCPVRSLTTKKKKGNSSNR